MTPRISFDGSKLVICACRRGSPAWLVGVHDGWSVRGACRVGTVGGYTGSRGGVLPTRIPVYWYCQGPTTASGLHIAPRRHSGPQLGPPHTCSSPVSIGRDIPEYILKLVNNPECHLKSMMRPVILPISKKTLINHDLEFLRFPLWLAFSP